MNIDETIGDLKTPTWFVADPDKRADPGISFDVWWRFTLPEGF